MGKELYGSRSRGYFSLEALLALIILASIIILLPRYNPNLDKAIVVKQASDISEVLLATGNLDNAITARNILERTNENLNLKIKYEGKEITVKWENPKNVIVLKRPRFENGRMIEVEFIFGY